MIVRGRSGGVPDRQFQREGRGMGVCVEFKPEDFWIGAFWKITRVRHASAGEVYFVRRVDLWICLVPMLPIHFHWHVD